MTQTFGVSWVATLLLVLLLRGDYPADAASKYSDTPDGRLLYACMNQDPSEEELLELLEDEEADINVKEKKSGQTPLMAAVLRGKTEVVRVLLENGADVKMGEKDGYTPAHGAGFQGRAEVMRLLHNHGINVVNDFHQDGFAPFHRACWGDTEGHTETVRYLLEHHGVDVNMEAKNGQTCAEMTKNEGTKEVLEEFASRREEL